MPGKRELFLKNALGNCFLAASLFIATLPNAFAGELSDKAGSTPAKAEAVEVRPKPPKTAIKSLSIFDRTKSSRTMFEGLQVVDVTADAAESAAAKDQDSWEAKAPAGTAAVEVPKEPEVKSPFPVSEKAPDSFKNIDLALTKRDVARGKGDWKAVEQYNLEAKKSSGEFVEYLKSLMFRVREMTSLIGEALIEKNVIQDEEWDGVEQGIDYQLASDAEETGSLIKATQDEAMKRIIPDPKQEVRVYYFFTLNCKYCRLMAPDVERLWRSVKSDKRVKMVGLTLGPQPKAWIDSYREYTGLSKDLPIQEGSEVAKFFNIKFAPAVVVVTYHSKMAYLKTGQESFEHLYEFVRTAQGVSTEVTPEIAKLINEPIGYVEKHQQKSVVRPTQANNQIVTTPVSEKINKSQAQAVRF